MLLSTQIQTMLYAFMMGLAYGILFSMKQYFCMYLNSSFRKNQIDILFHLIFVCIAYYGLFKINGGVNNLYIILLFFIAVYLYYILYYRLFLSFFKGIKKIGKPIYYKIYLLSYKFYCIIKKDRRRKKHGFKKKKKEKLKS